MVKTGNHVKQLPIVIFLCASITEERFVDLFAVNRERTMFGAIGPQATTVLVDVLVIGGLIHVPDTAIPIRLLIQRDARCIAFFRFLCGNRIGS